MRKVLTIIYLSMLAVGMCAQQHNNNQQQGNTERFSPEKFDTELQQFIVKEANLTPQESAKFFPVYKEMQRKQRALFERQRQLGNIKPQDEKGCQKAIRDRDDIDVELRRTQQTYHNKFLDMLPASKVYDIIKAEERFHRRMLRRWSKPPYEKKK